MKSIHHPRRPATLAAWAVRAQSEPRPAADPQYPWTTVVGWAHAAVAAGWTEARVAAAVEVSARLRATTGCAVAYKAWLAERCACPDRVLRAAGEPVLCLNTGTVYTSARTANQALGVDTTWVRADLDQVFPGEPPGEDWGLWTPWGRAAFTPLQGVPRHGFTEWLECTRLARGAARWGVDGPKDVDKLKSVDKLWAVYAVTRRASGEVVYVGMHRGRLTTRWRGHVHKPSGALHGLIAREGPAAFAVHALEYTVTEAVARDLEARWMQRMLAAGEPLANRAGERTAAQRATGEAAPCTPVGDGRRRARTDAERAHLRATCASRRAVRPLTVDGPVGGEEFPSVVAAARWAGCAAPNVHAALGGRAACAGVHPDTGEPLGWVDADADAEAVERARCALVRLVGRRSTRASAPGGRVDAQPWWLSGYLEEPTQRPRAAYQLVDRCTGAVRAVGVAMAKGSWRRRALTRPGGPAHVVRDEHGCARAGQAVRLEVLAEGTFTEAEAWLYARVAALAAGERGEPLLNTEVAHRRLVNGRAEPADAVDRAAVRALRCGEPAVGVAERLVTLGRRRAACLRRLVRRLAGVLDLTRCGGDPLAGGVVCLNVDRVYASPRVAAEALRMGRADVCAAMDDGCPHWRRTVGGCRLVLRSLAEVCAHLDGYAAWRDGLLAAEGTTGGAAAAEAVDGGARQSVYALTHGDRCVYVGRTGAPLWRRMDQHVAVGDAAGAQLAQGADVHVLAVVTGLRAAAELERAWIRRALAAGEPLVNVVGVEGRRR